ncbi:MAG: C-GCAxxG-C-C family (seleno)protein [Clostridia bacterium]
MEEKRAQAQALFRAGYNCPQAVLLAFADELGLERVMAARLASSFGGGMGKLREVCGAASAMFMIAGLCYGYDDPKDHEAKSAHYALIQHLAAQFRERNGALLCRDLLAGIPVEGGSEPEERTEAYYAARPCLRLVGEAAALIEQLMNEKNGGEKKMKIAIPYDNGQVFQHFGHAACFQIYDVADGRVVQSTQVPVLGSGHGALASFLRAQQVEILICGGIGGGAQQALTDARIQFYGGVTGDADAAVQAYIDGTLVYNPNVQCTHHSAHTSCGDHDCASHTCASHTHAQDESDQQ